MGLFKWKLPSNTLWCFLLYSLYKVVVWLTFEFCGWNLKVGPFKWTLYTELLTCIWCSALSKYAGSQQFCRLQSISCRLLHTGLHYEPSSRQGDLVFAAYYSFYVAYCYKIFWQGWVLYKEVLFFLSLVYWQSCILFGIFQTVTSAAVHRARTAVLVLTQLSMNTGATVCLDTLVTTVKLVRLRYTTDKARAQNDAKELLDLVHKAFEWKINKTVKHVNEKWTLFQN